MGYMLGLGSCQEVCGGFMVNSLEILGGYSHNLYWFIHHLVWLRGKRHNINYFTALAFYGTIVPVLGAAR